MAGLQAQTDELRQHEEQTDFAMTAARSGVSYRDLGSSFVELSPSIAQLFGLPPDVRRLSQDELYERVHPDDGQLIRAAVQKAIDERGRMTVNAGFSSGAGW